MKTNKNMKYLSTLISLILLTILVSCKKDETVSPVNNTTTTQSQYNQFRGYLEIYDYIKPGNKPSFKVEVLGNNNEVISQTYSDTSGFIKFDSLKSGTWDLRFSRPGWIRTTFKSIYHGQGPKPTLYYSGAYLSRKINTTILDFKLDSVENSTGNHYFTLTMNASPLDTAIDKLKLEITDNQNYFSISSSEFIPPNKLKIKSYLFWQSGQTRTLKVGFNYNIPYYLYDEALKESYNYEWLPEVKTFTITKP
jgi:hypothetical protein